MILGGNILNLALSIIGNQSFQYKAFLARTPNEIGLDVSTYATPVTLNGNVQPVPRQLYQQYGLDFQRNYFTFFVSKNILDVDRDVSGDQIISGGVTFQVISKTDWYAANGWDSFLAVQVT